MITNLHHVAILTSNMEDAIEYYTNLLGVQTPRIVEVNRPGIKLRSAMLPIGPSGETYLQRIEPSLGPGVAELERGGDGTLFEVGFQVDNIEAFHDQMDTREIRPQDLAGDSIEDKYIESKFGNRYFFLPKDKTKGTRLEFVQVINK